MIMNVLNNNAVTDTNYREKICEFKYLLEQLTSFIDDIVTNRQSGLPDGLPATVSGTDGVMQILKCGRSKATDIMNNPKYQSAFYGGKGTRKRLCNTRELLTLMQKYHE